MKLKKDATNGETRRGVVRTQRSVDIRMGKPGHRNGWSSARKGTRGTETSKYPEEKKSNEMPTVAASEEGRAQTCKLRLMGGED